MTGGSRALGLLVLAWKLQDSLDAAASVEAGHGVPQSTWSDWTLTQASVLLLASLLLPLPACLAACMSAPRDDATGTARMVHLAEAWVASMLVAGGPGAVLTGLLWSLSADGTLPAMGYAPWIIAGPLAIQSTLVGMMLMVLVIVLLVTESRPAWNIILAFLACALLMTSAILLPVLPAARLEPLTRSNATDEGGSLSWVATAVPAYLLAILLAVALLATEQVADAGVGAWTPLRFDSLVVLGFGTTALLLALAMDAGMQLPSREHPLGVAAADPLASPLLVALPALLCQCTVLVVDAAVLLLQGLAACGVLSIEPDLYMGAAPSGGVFASDGVGSGAAEDGAGTGTGAAGSLHDRGWGPFLMLDDSLMANIALDFAVADGAVAGVGKTARRGSTGNRPSAAGRRGRAGSGRAAKDGDGGYGDDGYGDEHDGDAAVGGARRGRRRGSASRRRGESGADGKAAGLDEAGRSFGRRSTGRAASGDGQASRQLTYEGAGEGVGVSHGGETLGSVQRERPPRGGSGGVGLDPLAEKALAARRRVIALRQRGVVMTEWRGEDVAAWLEAVVGWVDLAETAAVGLASRACDGEAEGSVLMRLWLRGRSSGGRWADLEEAVGCGRGGIDVLVRSLVGEAGARPQADSVKWDGTPVARTQSAHGHTGTGGAGKAHHGGHDDGDDDDDDDSWGFDGEDELAFAAADDDALERVLRLARGAARRHEGGAVAAAKAEARSARERRLARMPRAWPSTVWLPQVGLPQLAPQFERAGITPERLAAMRKTSDFAAIGVESRLHQRSLRAGVHFLRRHHFDLKGEIAELRREKWLPRPVLPDHLPAWTNREVVAWLRTSLPLDQEQHARQIEKLRMSGLHGALLFSRRPFNPDDILAGFGLNRSSARGALVSRIAVEMAALGHSGASAAVNARSAARGGAEAAAMARRPRASSASASASAAAASGAAAESGNSEAGRVEGKDEERVRRPSSTGTGDSGGAATSGGGTRSSFRKESVASASAFEAAFSPEALAAMVPTAANDAVLAAGALAAIGGAADSGRRKSGMLGAFALPGLTGPDRNA